VVVALVGTTASGKSAVAEAVARQVDQVELVSMDSMSVYRGMDIGTAKPSAAVRAEIPYHLVDLVPPTEEYTVSQFQSAARHALADIAGRGSHAVLVGGTGLYLRAVLDDLDLPGRWPEVAEALAHQADAPDGLAGLYAQLQARDPVAASRMLPANRRRIIRALEVIEGSGRPFSSFGPGLERYPPRPFALIGLPFDPAVVDRRIRERFERWLDGGLLDEVRALLALPGGPSRTARQALGYRELLAHLEQGTPLDECVELAIRRTRRFARRQRAWFRRDPRIRWVDPGEDPVAVVAAAITGGRPTGPGAPTGAMLGLGPRTATMEPCPGTPPHA
jgi:tRNA dimethylallyltransferase